MYPPRPHHGRAFSRPVATALKILLILLASLLAEAACAQTVYITRTGEKYHADACRYLSRSKIAFSLKDAVANGYTACSVCKPGSSTSTQRQNVTPQTTTTSSPSTATARSTSRQCSGITKSGARCKRMTTSVSGRCYQH